MKKRNTRRNEEKRKQINPTGTLWRTRNVLRRRQLRRHWHVAARPAREYNECGVQRRTQNTNAESHRPRRRTIRPCVWYSPLLCIVTTAFGSTDVRPTARTGTRQKCTRKNFKFTLYQRNNETACGTTIEKIKHTKKNSGEKKKNNNTVVGEWRWPYDIVATVGRESWKEKRGRSSRADQHPTRSAGRRHLPSTTRRAKRTRNGQCHGRR